MNLKNVTNEKRELEKRIERDARYIWLEERKLDTFQVYFQTA